MSSIKVNVTPVRYDQSLDLAKKQILLGPNPNRIGILVYHESSGSLLILFGDRKATDSRYTTQIGNQTEWEYSPPKGLCYTGEITFKPSVAGNGSVMVTEFILEES